MQYRTIGSTGFEPSALGFGCMRLPVRENDADIDEPLAIAMLRCAIDSGVNYIDTAYAYHGGNSESLVAKALAGGYRERVALATKMPVWLVNAPEDFDRLFDEQRKKLETDRIDFYLLHCLQKPSWPKMRDLGALDWLERRKAKGHIGAVGFSFHDELDVFKDIVDGYDGWEFCQIQHNFLHIDVQAGTAGLKYAAERGLGVIIMEPLFGGALARPPEEVCRLWEEASTQRSPVDWALQWLWSQPEVSLVLSGMSTLEQVRENVRNASRSGVGSLTPAELELVERVREQYAKYHAVSCTRCGYCMPCPEGVNIPKNFELYNDAAFFGGNSLALNRNLYQGLPAEARATACVRCGQCEEKCPQKIAIPDELTRVDKKLGAKNEAS